MGLEAFRKNGIVTVKGADELVDVLDLPNRLGLTDETDVEWLTMCVNLSALKIPGTHTAEVLKNPYNEAVRKYRPIRWMIELLKHDEEERKNVIREMEKELIEFKNEMYISPQESQRAVTIKSAVHMLMSRGFGGHTIFDKNAIPTLTIESDKQLDDWATYWKAQIESTSR